MEISSSTEETRASQPQIQSNPVSDHSTDFIPIEERKWNDIPAYEKVQRTHFGIQHLVKPARHRDQEERKTDGAVHWKSMGPKLRHAFLKEGGYTFSDSDWLDWIYRGSNKTRFQYCKHSHGVLLCIRAIQGHTGGYVIALELMGLVAIPLRWNYFLCHRGCSFDVKSILQAGLVSGGTERKEGRQTAFFTRSRRRIQPRLIEAEKSALSQ